MQRVKRMLERGDTLVEVMLAVAILSLATVLTMTLVNREHSSALAAINRASVRSEINSQVELLWYFHDIGVRAEGGDEKIIWNELSNTRAVVSDERQRRECEYGAKPFYLNTNQVVPSVGSVNDVVKAEGLSAYSNALYSENSWQVKPGRGIWIDTEKVKSGGLEYIDFYVKACWRSTTGREEHSSTVVRMNLYE